MRLDKEKSSVGSVVVVVFLQYKTRTFTFHAAYPAWVPGGCPREQGGRHPGQSANLPQGAGAHSGTHTHTQ